MVKCALTTLPCPILRLNSRHERTNERKEERRKGDMHHFTGLILSGNEEVKNSQWPWIKQPIRDIFE